MAAEDRTAGYTNRPPAGAPTVWQSRLERHPGGQVTGRAVDRMVLALRAYEQRAQRRAALQAWLAAGGGLAGRPGAVRAAR